MKSHQPHLRSDDFYFVKTEKGDVIRRGQTSRNRLTLVFLGLVEIGLFAVIVSFLQKVPINWLGLGFSILFVAAIGWLMGYIIRLQRVPPLRFDSQSKAIRFEQNGKEQHVPFVEIRGIDISFQQHPDSDAQNSGTYQIVAFLTGVRSLPIAQISGIKDDARERAQKLVALIEEVTEIRTKPAADMTAKMKTIQGTDFGSFNLGMIAQHLGRIQQEGGQDNFVIFESDSRANYFIQFTGQKGDSSLYAEAAGNPVIPKNYRLDQEKLSKLQQLGWEPPLPNSPNHHLQWQANSYNDRLAIAKIVMQTLVDVYGADPEQPLEVNLNLK
jgi:desulfoferrodoxin (superoxide reductase-like protein)